MKDRYNEQPESRKEILELGNLGQMGTLKRQQEASTSFELSRSLVLRELITSAHRFACQFRIIDFVKSQWAVSHAEVYQEKLQ